MKAMLIPMIFPAILIGWMLILLAEKLNQISTILGMIK